jgi:uncharacterized protein (TIRG00374 family)
VLRGTDPGSIADHVASVPPAGLALGLATCAMLNVGHNVFRVWRWRALLAPVRRDLAFRPMFDAVILGYLASWTLPGRLGELVRPALLAGRAGLPLGPCVGSVLADRMLDGVAVIAIFALAVAVTPLAPGAADHAGVLRDASLVVIALVGVPLVALLVASVARSRLDAMLAGRKGALVWVVRSALAFARGTEALARPSLLARALLYTVGAWAMIVAATWAGIRASGVNVSPGAVGVLLPLLVLGIALPTPGGAGSYHLAMKVGLVRFFEVSEPAAVAAGLLVHLAIVVPIVLLGVVLLVVDRIPLQDLYAAARQVKALGQAARDPAAARDVMER